MPKVFHMFLTTYVKIIEIGEEVAYNILCQRFCINISESKGRPQQSLKRNVVQNDDLDNICEGHLNRRGLSSTESLPGYPVVH